MCTADLYDLTVGVIIIIFAIRGYQKGLINQIGALISMIVGVIVSIRFTPMLAAQLPGSDNVRYVCALIILLLAATLIVWGFVNALSNVISRLKLNYWNNQMGALLGVVYGLLWTMTLTFVLLVYAVPISEIVVDENGNQVENRITDEQSFVMQSRIGPNLTIVTLGIIDHLPHGGDYQLYDYLRDYLQQNANGIKKDNPNLQADSFSTLGDSAQDDDKPRLPPSDEHLSEL